MHNKSEEYYINKYLKYKNKYLILNKLYKLKGGDSFLTESGNYIFFYNSKDRPDEILNSYKSLTDFTNIDFTSDTKNYVIIGHIKDNTCKLYINNYAHVDISTDDCNIKFKDQDSFNSYIELIIKKYHNKNFNDKDLKDQNINRFLKKWNRAIYVKSSTLRWFDVIYKYDYNYKDI